MSDVITFNTEDAAKNLDTVQSVKIFDLVKENDPILKIKTPEFDFSNPSVDPVEFASSLVETCKTKGGFGLAANQCGHSLRVFVMGADDEYVSCFNPNILEKTKEETIVAEGCLSFSMLALKISRPKSIVVEYYDYNGERHEVQFDGLTSHIFQHELDHLNGICYTERAKPMALKMGYKKREKFNKLVDRYETAKKKIKQISK